MAARRWLEREWGLEAGSYRVSCFFLLSTFRKDPDSDPESPASRDGQIRIITLTWRHGGGGGGGAAVRSKTYDDGDDEDDDDDTIMTMLSTIATVSFYCD